MQSIDWEEERRRLDREITYFHFKKANRLLIKLIRLAKKHNELFFINYFTGQKYMLNEDFNKAIEFFNRALRVRPNDGCTYNDKAICLAELGYLEEAIACFDEGLRRDRNSLVLYHNKGWLLNLLGNYKDAIMCFKKVLEIEPNRPESLYSLADTYFNIGDYRLASVYFKRAFQEIRGKSSYIYKEILRRLEEIKYNFKLSQESS
ncbi:MAG: tetratricopeptide repeat protein [Candidatus Omnitrophica bacterium]|nr:tetratricopeptide repeat protein [Candidatus Omnitrophota bacterium]